MSTILQLALLWCSIAFAQVTVVPDTLPEKAKVILESATSLEIYSLDPKAPQKDPLKDAENGTYFSWKILGKTSVNDNQKKQLLDAIKKGIAQGKQGARCFWPRHGIRASHKGEVVDLVICFECSWVYVFYDGKIERHETLVTDKSSQDLLNRILRDAKVILPDPPKK